MALEAGFDDGALLVAHGGGALELLAHRGVLGCEAGGEAGHADVAHCGEVAAGGAGGGGVVRGGVVEVEFWGAAAGGGDRARGFFFDDDFRDFFGAFSGRVSRGRQGGRGGRYDLPGLLEGEMGLLEEAGGELVAATAGGGGWGGVEVLVLLGAAGTGGVVFAVATREGEVYAVFSELRAAGATATSVLIADFRGGEKEKLGVWFAARAQRKEWVRLRASNAIKTKREEERWLVGRLATSRVERTNELAIGRDGTKAFWKYRKRQRASGLEVVVVVAEAEKG